MSRITLNDGILICERDYFKRYIFYLSYFSSALVPVFSFGEQNVMDRKLLTGPRWIAFNKLFRKLTRGEVFLLKGRGGTGSPLPYRRPVTTVGETWFIIICKVIWEKVLQFCGPNLTVQQKYKKTGKIRILYSQLRSTTSQPILALLSLFFFYLQNICENVLNFPLLPCSISHFILLTFSQIATHNV